MENEDVTLQTWEFKPQTHGFFKTEKLDLATPKPGFDWKWGVPNSKAYV